MNISIRSVRCTVLVAAISFLFSFGAAAAAPAGADLGQPAGSIVVPSGMTAAEVQTAIVAALSGRQWLVTEKTTDRVVGYIKHRKNEATLTLIYDTSKIELYCVGWRIDKTTGEREKPEQPKGWIKYIEKDLTRNLNRGTAAK